MTVFAVLLGLACGGGNESEACGQWLECLETMGSNELNDWEASHGPQGSCWGASEDGNLQCEAVCEQAYEAQIIWADDTLDGVDNDCDGQIDEDVPDSAL